MAQADRTRTEEELGHVLVEALNLDVEADAIAPEQSLFGDGLGLDSIDALEIAMEVSRRYGVQLRADTPNNQEIFASLRALASYVDAHRTR